MGEEAAEGEPNYLELVDALELHAAIIGDVGVLPHFSDESVEGTSAGEISVVQGRTVDGLGGLSPGRW